MNSSTGHASVDDLPDPALPGAPAGPLPRFSARTRRAPGVAGGAVLLVPSPSPRLARARRALAAALLLVLATALAGCSVQKLASKSVADSLTKGPDVFGTDNDPELVRDALPFGLKTMEMLLHNLPNHEGLLVTLCKGFTQYSYAFVQTDGDLLVNSDYARSSALHERAFWLLPFLCGIGAMLLNQNKHFHIAEVFAIQIVILTVGIAQDYAIGALRNLFCPYASLTLERK